MVEPPQDTSLQTKLDGAINALTKQLSSIDTTLHAVEQRMERQCGAVEQRLDIMDRRFGAVLTSKDGRSFFN